MQFAPDEAVPQAPTRRRFIIACALFCSVVISYLDRSNLSIVAPKLSADLHLSPVSTGFMLSAFGWTYAAFQVPTSWFVDRLHPRLLYCIILVLWSLCTLCLGLAASIVTLVILRLAIGTFEAPAYPINNRVVTTWFGENERAGAIGFYTSGQFVGLAFLTPVLSWLAVTYGWRSIFFISGTTGLVWAGAWWLLYRDPREFPGVNAAEIDIIATNGGVIDFNHHHARIVRNTGWSDLGLILGSKKLWGIYIGQFGMSCTLWFFLTWFPTYLVNFRHLDFMRAGLLASLPFVAAFVGVLTGGFTSDFMLRRRISLTVARKTPIVCGLLLASLIFYANFLTKPEQIIACLCCSFFGCGFASISWSLVSALAPTRLIGLTGGVFNFFSNLAAVTVPIVIGVLVRGQNFAWPLVFISAMAILGALSYVFLVGKIERVTG
jgi:MFS transporter, ACS family, D-galactonate transporter